MASFSHSRKPPENPGRFTLPAKLACRLTVDTLALAHERGCEAELAPCGVRGPHSPAWRFSSNASTPVGCRTWPFCVTISHPTRQPARHRRAVGTAQRLQRADGHAHSGRGGMTRAAPDPNPGPSIAGDDLATHSIDVARLSIVLNVRGCGVPAPHSADLRLPAIKHIWPSFAERADREGWPAARFLAALAEHEIAERAQEPRLGAASNVISAKPACHRARASTASTSMPCRWSPRRGSWPSSLATAGWRRAPTSSCSAHLAEESRTWRRPSASA